MRASARHFHGCADPCFAATEMLQVEQKPSSDAHRQNYAKVLWAPPSRSEDCAQSLDCDRY
jgi:hypothetical protein